MKIERDERRFDFHDIGLAIKRAREASGMTQEQLAYIVDRAPRTIMYNENDGQHPSLNTFYQMVTMFDISVDQYFYMKQKITMKTSKNLTVGEAVELFFRKAAVKNLSNINLGMQEKLFCRSSCFHPPQELDKSPLLWHYISRKEKSTKAYPPVGGCVFLLTGQFQDRRAGKGTG